MRAFIEVLSTQKLGGLVSFIANYGLFWRRDRVEWGTRGRGNAGSLLGYAAGAEVGVDFRQQAGVYVLFDGADIPSLKVTYVGQVGRRATDSLLGRLREHQRDHLWNRWTRFSWFGVHPVGRAGTLIRTSVSRRHNGALAGVIDHLEGVLITMLEPPLNKRGANWDGATQFFQDEHRENEIIQRLDALDRRLDAHLGELGNE